MAPVQEADYQNGINGSGKCPVLNSNLSFPPAAPIPFKRSSPGQLANKKKNLDSCNNDVSCSREELKPVKSPSCQVGLPRAQAVRLG